MTNREKYIKKYKEMAKGTITNEKLPFPSEILNYANHKRTSKQLRHVFDFFDDEEEFSELVNRTSLSFDDEESKEFIDSVIAANVTDISKSGSIYKMLMACGDNYRMTGLNCGSKGREMSMPVSEDDFKYHVKNSNCYFDDDKKDLQMFDNYKDFKKACKGHEKLFIRTPMTCKHHKRRGCCPVCAGNLPVGIENLGAFATLMITEVATQNALQSMNAGKKVNANDLLTQGYDGQRNLKSYYEWCEKILDDLAGDKVQRRFYEMALLSRLFIEDNKIRVSSLRNPNTDNYFGEFIYRPKEKSYRDMITKKEFLDNSLKGQIALDDFKKGVWQN